MQRLPKNAETVYRVNAIEADVTLGSLVRESGLPKPEAELLLCFLLGHGRAHLIAHAEEAVSPTGARCARDWFARRRLGEPAAYITGWREFYGMSLRVTPDVLIPRPETELLVELALERIPADSSAGVLELGTGSGAIALALAKERPGLRITATDISQAALALARENAQRHGVEIEFVQGDWFEGLGPGPFDLIVSNPPYVAAGDEHLERGDVRFEPRLALVGGESGLSCIKAIVGQARSRLRPRGQLLLEHGYDQRVRCIELFRELGYAEVEDYDDLAGLPRVCAGRQQG